MSFKMESILIVVLASLCLPVNSSCTSGYVVRESDNCETISWMHRLSLVDFLKMNEQIDCGNLKTGTFVCVNSIDSKITPFYTETPRNKFWDKFFGLTDNQKMRVSADNKFTDSIMEVLL